MCEAHLSVLVSTVLMLLQLLIACYVCRRQSCRRRDVGFQTILMLLKAVHLKLSKRNNRYHLFVQHAKHVCPCMMPKFDVMHTS